MRFTRGKERGRSHSAPCFQRTSVAFRLGGKVTTADVAAAAGVDLQTATMNVRDMAYLTGAAIVVSPNGELLYDFGMHWPPFPVLCHSLRVQILRILHFVTLQLLLGQGC